MKHVSNIQYLNDVIAPKVRARLSPGRVNGRPPVGQSFYPKLAVKAEGPKLKPVAASPMAKWAARADQSATAGAQEGPVKSTGAVW